jgi:peptidoglycan-N-acetylglucosamine deacetylase
MKLKIVHWLFLLTGAVNLSSCQNPEPTRPAGGIALSFDDRFIKEWAMLRPLFKKYNVRATFYITQFQELTAEEIELLRQLQADGHEIGAHGAMHTRSVYYVLQHSMDDYFKNEIDAELTPMHQAGFRPVTFAHPGGQQTWLIDRRLLKNYFVLLRDVSLAERNVSGLKIRRSVPLMDEIYHRFDGDPTVSSLLFDRNTGATPTQLTEGLIRAKNTRTALMLFGHKPLAATDEFPYGFDISLLEHILAEAHRLGLKSYTMRELVAYQ